MKKAMFAALSAFVVIAAHAESSTPVSRNYVIGGADDLRPTAVTQVDGHMHLLFDVARAPELPVPLALGDDGLLRPVNFKTSPRNSGTEFVLLDRASTIVLKLGDREAIIQDVEKCSLDGVHIIGSANVSCVE